MSKPIYYFLSLFLLVQSHLALQAFFSKQDLHEFSQGFFETSINNKTIDINDSLNIAKALSDYPYLQINKLSLAFFQPNVTSISINPEGSIYMNMSAFANLTIFTNLSSFKIENGFLKLELFNVKFLTKEGFVVEMDKSYETNFSFSTDSALSIEFSNLFTKNYKKLNQLFVNSTSQLFDLDLLQCNLLNQNLAFEVHGLKFEYSFQITQSLFTAEGVTSQIKYTLFNETEIRKFSIDKCKNHKLKITNIQIDSGFLNQFIRKIHEKHYFDFNLTSDEIMIEGFTFYLGDLYFELDSLDNYTADEPIKIVCAATQEYPPNVIIRTDNFQIVYKKYFCQILIAKDDSKIFGFRLSLHTLHRLDLIDNSLNFNLIEAFQEGDVEYIDYLYKIKRTDIFDYWIKSGLERLKVNAKHFDALKLPLLSSDKNIIKLTDEGINICGDKNRC